MCGIAGIVCTLPHPARAETIARMTRALAHRGPDGEATIIRGPLALGHRRLSIIDLEGGAQPMCNEDGTLWIVLNGEIYNYPELRSRLQSLGHTFKTRSDTEVILHGFEQWGIAVLERLRGMFAFALADTARRRLVLARDRFGIKPLCYLDGATGFLFGSELCAIEAGHPGPLTGDLCAIEMYLRYQYIPAPRTIYHEVLKLPPAHYLEVRYDDDGVPTAATPRRYWRARMAPVLRHRARPDLLETLAEHIDEAVRSHLIADVPVGVFLSGGVDSTLVAARICALRGSQLKAFTIGFVEDSCNELGHAEAAARQLGVEHIHEIVHADAASLLPRIVQQFGEPFGDSSALPTWHLSRMTREHVPVALSGDGGDELFGGYRAYTRWWQQSVLGSTLEFVREPRPGRLRTLMRGLRQLDRVSRRRRLASWETQMLYFLPAERRALWHRPFTALVDAPCAAFEDAASDAPRWHGTEFAQHVDLHTYLPNDVLTKVDICTMAHGLEARPPLLDHVLAELAFTLPPEMHLEPVAHPHEGGKRALKHLLAREFPDAFVYRRKQGFGIPVAAWFESDRVLATMFRDLVLAPRSTLRDFFDARELHRLIDRHRPGSDRSGRLWVMLVLAIWLEQHPALSWRGPN